MEERDYLKKQIDILGMVLAKLLSDLIGCNKNSGVMDVTQQTNEVFKAQLDLDLEKMLAIPDSDIPNFLISREVSTENMERIADILKINILLCSDEQLSPEKRRLMAQKCLSIYNFINENDTTYSVARELKIREIKSVF